MCRSCSKCFRVRFRARVAVRVKFVVLVLGLRKMGLCGWKA